MLPVSICLDFGNTFYKAAIFQSDRLVERYQFKSQEALGQLKELLALYNPEKSILASVVNHDEAIVQLLRERTNYLKLDQHT